MSHIAAASSRQDGPMPPPPSYRNDHRRSVEDWEDWEDDDDVVTPIDPEEQVLVESPASPISRHKSSTAAGSRASYQSASRIKRLRSRHRQKAANARAGIKLITDMSSLRRQNNLAHQHPGAEPPKFVDAAALRALEGEPNSASVGNWNWLKNQKNKNQAPPSATPQSASARTPFALTPGDGGIMIGIALPQGDAGATPIAASASSEPRAAGQAGERAVLPAQDSPSLSTPGAVTPTQQQISVWSPDTPDTASSKASRACSSFYSQVTDASGSRNVANHDVPPVPALPSTYKKTPHQRLISLDLGNGADDDLDTPCTLFEEDGSPSVQRQPKSARGLAVGVTPDSAGSRSHGWWDHVVTPFMDRRFTFASRRTKGDSPSSPLTANTPREYTPQGHTTQSPLSHEETVDEKQPFPFDDDEKTQTLAVPRASPPPIVRVPTPRRTATPPQTNDVTQEPPSHLAALGLTDAAPAAMSEKPTTIATPEMSSETPPPYSPPRRPDGNNTEPANNDRPVRFRAVFPPGHPLRSQFPPSPGPASPGLAATMTSQGATAMTDIPITPTVPREMATPPAMSLPSRPVASNLPREYSHTARGPEHRVERERRRHEKEDIVAHRAGGFWRGRGCIPSTGCFGRPGREGRKRRRICLGTLIGLLLLIILSVVLGVVLTRPHKPDEAPPSIWVNLTDFPPMPTGVLTFAGPDNTVSRSGCTVPTSLWSCSLPKEEQDSVKPYDADQPTVIMQIQWDNSTAKQWDVPDGKVPHPDVASRSTRFTPSPDPPSFAEMWFLGNTTDGVKSDDKAGEPAPFYISILDSTDDPVEQPTLTKRQTTVGKDLVKDLVGKPDLLDNGTPAPARMLPGGQVKQQPVRLYDRGLPTEHYGFYTYFERTIYVKSVDADKGDAVPADRDGGSTKTEANHLVTWGQTRMLVQIWTRKLNGTGDDGNSSNVAQLVGTNVTLAEDGSVKAAGGGGHADDTSPGTMPYPVTVSLDTHGGDPEHKYVWQWPMDNRQRLDTDNPQLLPNNIGNGGTWINPRADNDTSFGGFDGGSGGCRCEWVNWV